jgi:decaprenyl-phosphate phosphoribosyltransferase
MTSHSALARSLVVLMRPHQWLKNVFVFAGLLFSPSWRDGSLLGPIFIAFAAFCCASSLVYIINDWRDRSSDAQHPEKRLRPLASGAVPLALALAMGIALLLAGLTLAMGNTTLLVLLGIYVLMNLAYSLGLKHVPVVDVSIIASGFMLRLLAGTLAVGIPPSRWLLLTGLFIALYLGFSKRRAESFHEEALQRHVMQHYPSSLLDTYLAVTMTATLMTYSLYATSPETLLLHGERLVYTVPVVIFGMLRYAYQVQRGRGEDVARDLLRDPWILLALILWLLIFLFPRF